MGLLVVGVGIGGYLLGAASGEPSTASQDELEQGLAVAMGLSLDELRDHPGFHAATNCELISCQLVVAPVPGPGTVMQGRLYDDGWVLHSHDEPECVSDNPYIRGFVCSYQKGAVTVSIQVESVTTPDELAIWASTG